ncbi:MAG: aldose 1-epimerase, partial [Geminicoccaceae bacterium]
MAPVRLSAGDLELVLDPDRGGSIMALRVRSFDLLRPCWDPEQPDPRRFACFPLVPFSGRIDRGRFVH